MTHILKKSDFNFSLAEDKIAKYPLSGRDSSKLLQYKNDGITHHNFQRISELLEPDTLLVMNNAKVIPARLYFKRETGAQIEVLLLEPVEPSSYDKSFSSISSCSWKCIIGNSKKWKIGESIGLIDNEDLIKARLVNREDRIVELSWSNGKAFTDLLDEIGELPLPPYLNRDTEEKDNRTYQTVFAKNAGSVAAPTAGLHFTDRVFESLEVKGVEKCEVTLHVGAGTFLPVKEENVINHAMHREHFEITRDTLFTLISKKKRVVVGTTSMRVLESLYWLGVKLKGGDTSLLVNKLEPYEAASDMSYESALEVILAYMNSEKLDVLQGATEIMILPHYTPKSIIGIITNFHLPESTLLMLIASVVGDRWRDIYKNAIENEYRFLSYGDSSLLFLES